MSSNGWMFGNHRLGRRFETKKKTKTEKILEERRRVALQQDISRPKGNIYGDILHFIYPILTKEMKKLIDDTDDAFGIPSRRSKDRRRKEEVRKTEEEVEEEEEEEKSSEDEGLGSLFPIDLVDKKGNDADTYEDW